MKATLIIALMSHAGCISVGDNDGATFQCTDNSDCDIGESCDENTCWGAPPGDESFAAVLLPPPDRPTIVPTELGIISIAPSGDVAGMNFASMHRISGQVVLECADGVIEALCDSAVSATITAERSASVTGLPAYQRTVVTTPDERGQQSFELLLPATTPGDAAYTITILPSNAVEPEIGGTPPARLAPPLRFSYTADANATVTWVIGRRDDHKTVRGRIADTTNAGVSGLQVSARGVVSPGAPLTRASSFGQTDVNGDFTLRVPIAYENTFTVNCIPEAGSGLPRVDIEDITIADPVVDEDILLADTLIPSIPATATFAVPISAQDAAGGILPVQGADVKLSTTLYFDGTTRVSYSASATTNQAGVATFELLPGDTSDLTYAIRVLAPLSSPYGNIELGIVEIGSAGGSLPTQSLPRRVPVSGTLYNSLGEPLAGTSVVVEPSLTYKWSLEPHDQAIVDQLPMPQVITDDNGGFVVWLESTFAGFDAEYNLIAAPVTSDLAPRWTIGSVTVDEATRRGLEGVELGEMTLPDVSNVRGTVRYAGAPVNDAEVRLYRVATDNTACTQTYAPPDCEAPAEFLGLWRSREDGQVQLVLPRP